MTALFIGFAILAWAVVLIAAPGVIRQRIRDIREKHYSTFILTIIPDITAWQLSTLEARTAFAGIWVTAQQAADAFHRMGEDLRAAEEANRAFTAAYPNRETDA